MCRSLAQAGHEVMLVVADGLGNDEGGDWRIIDMGHPNNRLTRATLSATKAAREATELRPDVIHFHDPELLPAIASTRRLGRTRLVFDAHENLPDQILGKHYLPRWSRTAVSLGYEALERIAVKRLDAIVAATPTIADRYRQSHNKVVCIANFPMANELHAATTNRSPDHAVCYVGGITPNRGIGQMVEALALTRSKVRLKLGGHFARNSDRFDVSLSPGWSLVDELGYLDRNQVQSTLAKSLAGLVTLQPTPAYIDAYPVKLFEYMSAGLPVIASDFPLWREIVEGAECGILVEPTNPRSIAHAIDMLVDNPEIAARMGRNGRKAVETTYNWSTEAQKLFSLYDEVVRDSS